MPARFGEPGCAYRRARHPSRGHSNFDEPSLRTSVCEPAKFHVAAATVVRPDHGKGSLVKVNTMKLVFGCSRPSEAIEHPLNTVSVLVGPVVAGKRVLAVGLWRNDRPDPMDQEFFTQEIAVIAFIGKEELRLADRYRQQIMNGVVIRSLATRQDEAEMASLTVCTGVDFCRKNRLLKGSFESRFR